MIDSEIRVRVTRADIGRAYEAMENGEDISENCALAQALMALGFASVDVQAADRVYIGLDRYVAIDERPGGERLWRLISDFDDVDAAELVAEPDEFVLRHV